MKNISVIGAGTMGNGIAHLFAKYGFAVSLVDPVGSQLEKALQTIGRNFDRQVAKQELSEEQKKSALSNIRTHTALTEGVKNADLVVEAAIENEAVKLNIFKELDLLAPPGCLLASNTSSISITKIAAATKRPGQVIGMHFMNPVPVIKLVEVITGYSTSRETINVIIDLAKKLGKTPCLVKDYPGFITNRILMPMINEAIYSLYEGVAGLVEIDLIMKLGMSHPMGPLQLADFIGLDTCHSILHILYEGFGNQKYAPCPLLTHMVNAGHFGIKTGEGFYLYTPDSKELVPSPRFR